MALNVTPSESLFDKLFPSMLRDIHSLNVTYLIIEPTKIKFDHKGYNIELEIKTTSK